MHHAYHRFNPGTVIPVKTNDSIWTAGLLDGTGSICLFGGNGPWLKPVVSMSNSDSSLLDALQAAHGGSISARRVREGHSDAWVWRVTGARQVIGFLKPIHPYMRCAVKQRRAELIVTEYEHVTRRNGVYSAAAAEAKRDFEARFLEIGTRVNKGAVSMVMDRG